jgi:hypothetical protein
MNDAEVLTKRYVLWKVGADWRRRGEAAQGGLPLIGCRISQISVLFQSYPYWKPFYGSLSCIAMANVAEDDRKASSAICETDGG